MTFDYIIPIKDEFTPEDNFISDKLLQKYVDMNNITNSDFNKWIDKYRHIIENESKQHNNFYKRYLKKKITKKQMGGIRDDNITFYIIAIISYIFFEKQINSMDNPNRKKKGGSTTISIASNDVSLRQFPKISKKFHDVPNISITNNDVSLRQFPKISKNNNNNKPNKNNISITNNDVSLRQFPKISKKFRDVPKNTFRNYQEHILQKRLNNLRHREQEIYQKNLEQQRERKRLEQIASKAEKKEYELRQTGQELQQELEEERRKEQKEMQKNQIGKGKWYIKKKEKRKIIWGKRKQAIRINQKRIEDANRAVSAAKYSIHILKSQINRNVGTNRGGNRVLFKAKRNGKTVFLKISVANVNMKYKLQIERATRNFTNLDSSKVGQYVTENILYKYFSDKEINMVEYIGHNLLDYDRNDPKIILPTTNINIADVRPYGDLDTINDWVKKLMVLQTYPGQNKFVLTVLVTGCDPDIVTLHEYLQFKKKFDASTGHYNVPDHVKESSIMKGLTFIHKLYHTFHFAHWDWHYTNIRVNQNTGDFYLFDLDRSQLITRDLKILPYEQSFVHLPKNTTHDKLLAYGYAHDINRFLFELEDLHMGYKRWISLKMQKLLKDIFGGSKGFTSSTSFYTWIDMLYNRLEKASRATYWPILWSNTKTIYDKYVEPKSIIGGKRGKRKIRTGPRGGKFVLIKGKKKYIH
jgi:cell division septum initiation protein DivIVA